MVYVKFAEHTTRAVGDSAQLVDDGVELVAILSIAGQTTVRTHAQLVWSSTVGIYFMRFLF